jgi:predicted metalloprotease with PDZ domain
MSAVSLSGGAAMASGLRVLALVLCVFLFVGGTPPPRIVYQLTPILEAGALSAIAVDVRFDGSPSGQTRLRLPDEWGGERELWRGLADLTVVAGARLGAGDCPAERVLTHAPNARIQLRYRIVQDWQGAPRAQQGNPYRPIIQPGYFHLIGHAALIIPDLDDNTMARVAIRGLPRGWSFASDLQHRPLHLAYAAPSVMVGGEYRVIRASNPHVRIAIRGDWSFSDADFAAQVSGILAAQRAFWGDRSQPYLVTVTQLATPDPGWTSVGGTGLDDAFAFFATPNAPSGVITRTLAHEGLHSWIPAHIGGMPEQGEAAHYWLSEGFTDFYTGRLLVRAGLWSPSQFAEDLNATLNAYASSPVNTAPNARILADFWNDSDVRQLPYQRGRLLATLWDARLRAAGVGDLDDVVMAMRTRARSEEDLDAAALLPGAMQSLGVDPSADLDAHVERGALILLPEAIFAPCGRVETRTAPAFHRGFDIAATQANNSIIAGVVRDGPAYAAGMRDGMLLVRRDGGEIGDAEREIGYVVREGQTERTLRYMPQGRDQITRQRFVVAADLGGDALARCVAVLGGA